MRVVVLGASSNPERYSNKAVRMLKDADCDVVPVHPRESAIEGFPVARSLEEVEGDVHTLTVYLRPERSLPLAGSMIALAPRRVILNPGTESPELEQVLNASAIRVVNACTLVLLRTGQFESA